jgi:hypothetical protein
MRHRRSATQTRMQALGPNRPRPLVPAVHTALAPEPRQERVSVRHPGNGAGAQTAASHFDATVSRDPVKAKFDFAPIVDEVGQHFTTKPSPAVTISVEIQAEAATGFDDATQQAGAGELQRAQVLVGGSSKAPSDCGRRTGRLAERHNRRSDIPFVGSTLLLDGSRAIQTSVGLQRCCIAANRDLRDFVSTRCCQLTATFNGDGRNGASPQCLWITLWMDCILTRQLKHLWPFHWADSFLTTSF